MNNDILNPTFNNLDEKELIKHALRRNEGVSGIGDCFMVTTGTHTGRSPNDKFFVLTPSVENTICWDNNRSMPLSAYNQLKADIIDHAQNLELFSQDLYAGADQNHQLNVKVITEFAWHSLFIRHLLRIPNKDQINDFVTDYTIINCPSFKADPERHGCRSDTVIAINMDEKMVLIGGTEYAGEIKKSIFSILNYLLPERGVMPMHCSANHAINDTNDTAVFFGLSGTGKTTLSADASRILIGDDEHGWSDDGVFNFEGGCYAKTINLDPDAEPEIYATTRRYGTVIENMIYDETSKELNFKDDRLTANMRCAYPLDYIPNASKTSIGGHPKNIIMLTCDAFGVLPPVAKLTPEQAVYHFLSGFTAKVAGTERGITEPQPTFSTCFGAPFMPRKPQEYGDLLKQKIEQHGAKCWLVNTGWTGGGYGVGNRISIKDTRALLQSILNENIYKAEYRTDDNFGFDVPLYVDGVDRTILNPRDTWDSADDYDTAAKKLVTMFEENFKRFEALR